MRQEDKVSVPQTDSRNLHCLMRLLAFVVELMSKLVARYAHALWRLTPKPRLEPSLSARTP